MTDFRFFKPALNQLGVSADEALDLFREQNRTLENPVYCEVMQVFQQLPDICNIRGGYFILENIEISVSDGKIIYQGTELAAGRKVCSYMKDSQDIAVFICSAGEDFSSLSKQSNSAGDYLKGYIVDTFGSLTAEKTADFIQNKLQEECLCKGLNITNRYSPGYCNWLLSGQKKLFELLPDNPCNISLTDSMLMKPIKSVSGIIGIGKNVKKREYACEVCNDLSCTYRNILNRN